jgi:predicted RNase H-like nuclease (RuvC/YqgF family)
MLVPMARALSEETRVAAHWHKVREDDLVRQVDHFRTAWESVSARNVELEQEGERLRRRVGRLRRRLREARSRAGEDRPAARRWSRWLRG